MADITAQMKADLQMASQPMRGGRGQVLPRRDTSPGQTITKPLQPTGIDNSFPMTPVQITFKKKKSDFVTNNSTMSHVYFMWERLDLNQVKPALSSIVLDLQPTPDGFTYFQGGGGVRQLSSVQAGI